MQTKLNYYDGVIVTSFVNIKSGDVTTQIALYRHYCFFCGQKDFMRIRFTL